MNKTIKRKEEHIRICLEEDVQARSISTGLEDVYIVHRALPEISMGDIDVSTKIFGFRLDAPIIIESMTGGTKKGAEINEKLATATENLGLAMGVGSQRVALENPKVAYTFKTVRKKAPNAFLIANLGICQVEPNKFEEIEKAIEMIEADALALHLNPLQEAIQPEGNHNYEGVIEKIEKITSHFSLPIIIKETGSGIAFEEAKLLENVGVNGIDVAGSGGTSWAAVESIRAKLLGDLSKKTLGDVFWDWGIPTAVSVFEVSQSVDLEVIASGGLRTGIDIAKVISIGADSAGFAYSLLKPVIENRVEEYLSMLIKELKTTMFLIGAKTINDLKKSSVIILGKTAEWLTSRGFEIDKLCRRKII